MVESIIQDITANFNFAYMLTVNILTYLIINLIDIWNKEATVTFWQKRIVLLLSIIAIGSIYYFSGKVDVIILINSSVAAPVFWSWVVKPILSTTKYDYKKIDNCLK